MESTLHIFTGNDMHVVHTQCKVLQVGNYPNPSLSPFVEVCCSILGFFKLFTHLVYDIIELLCIFTYFHLLHPFSPTSPLRRSPLSWG